MNNENKKDNNSNIEILNYQANDNLTYDSFEDYIENKHNLEKENINKKTKKNFDLINKIFGKKFHIGFEARVIASILFILLLIVWACLLILNAFNFGHNMKIAYSEESNIDYEVCVQSVDYYPNTCLNEGMEYVTAIVDKIKMRYKYNLEYSNLLTNDLSYHIVAITKVYDINNNKKVLYQNEDLLVKKMELKNSKKVSLDKKFEIDFKKYNEFFNSYKNNYTLSSAATLEVIMYLDEKDETRKIASTVFPLGNQTFGITKNTISNLDKEIILNNNTWSSYNVIFAIIGSALIIVALLILFKLTKLVLKVSSNRDEYQTKLSYILREYDRLIVIARNGFVTTVEKNITEVDNFNELLDARKLVDRPIIYSKINDVKSEFIVEDDYRIYKYVMKESDFNK